MRLGTRTPTTATVSQVSVRTTGSQAFNGAAPEGWPAYSNRPEEGWADCVSRAFTGIVAPSHGLPDCSGGSLDWAATWLSRAP